MLRKLILLKLMIATIAIIVTFNLNLELDMDLQQLKLFLHLCESKNFARTAAVNYLSPSTLSDKFNVRTGNR